MNAIRRLAKRLKASMSGRQEDNRLREELAEHLELLTDEYTQQESRSTRRAAGRG